MTSQNGYTTPIQRFYVDVRPLIPANKQSPADLPLITTLRDEQQEVIRKFLRPADRLMSLASALLKYLFIHRYALVPWNEVRISKTPKPHGRPYWRPERDWDGKGGLEFNVTHQNGMVALLGCKTPVAQNQDYFSPMGGESIHFPATPGHTAQQVRLGVDLACTHEDGRTPKDVISQAKLDEWVDIFGEMFSEQSRDEIKQAHIPGATGIEVFEKRLRRFYAYWSLKEAFIKMVGEGLLADWLVELEFDNVQAPEPATADDFPDDGFSWAFQDEEERKWTPPDKSIKNITAVLRKQKLNDVHLTLVAFEQDFLLATSMRGVRDEDEATARWVKLDIEKDIRPCAEGRCQCLNRRVVDIAAGLTNPVLAAPTDERDHRIIQADATI
jgi:4'-phosphopantetheinyl transferase